MPPPEPERAGSKEEKSDTPIAEAARRLRSNYKEMFVPGQTEYSQVMCKAVTELFTRSVTKTETNKMERVEAVTDLGAILVERFDDLKEAEAEHAHDLERSKEENKELEELSQELGVYDAPEKYTFEKKEAFIIGKYKQRYRDSERSTKRQAVERQDFDRAKLIKQEAEYLRREMEARESILSNPRGTSRGVARN